MELFCGTNRKKILWTSKKLLRLHRSECAQRNSSILLFSCRDTLKFSHCGQSVVCKMCKIIFYSVLHFVSRYVIIFFLSLSLIASWHILEFRHVCSYNCVNPLRYFHSLTHRRITVHIAKDCLRICSFFFINNGNASAIGWVMERES